MIGEFLSPAGVVAILPIAAAILLALWDAPASAGWIGIGVAAVTFAAACLLPGSPMQGALLLVDPLSADMAMLTSFVGLTSAVFSRGYIARAVASGGMDHGAARQSHALLQAFLGATLLAMLANNLGVAWVAVEAATIAAVMAVASPRTADAVGAAWRYFILCGVGISLALFGTFLLYLAAVPAVGAGYAAMSWSGLTEAAPQVEAPLLNLAFVFLLLGYGTKAALVPLHGWMPDAHAEGPTPISAVLAGSILNAALLILIRLRAVISANADALDPGPPLMILGLASVLLAAFSLWRRRDIKRFFAFSTIEQSGVAAFAIGLGGSAALFAGLLHITVHTLAKSALFQCVGRASQLKGVQTFAGIGGLWSGSRTLALTLTATIIAVAGLPPFGLFTSEWLIVVETIRTAPLAAIPLALGLVVGGWALAARLIGLCLDPATPDTGSAVVPVDLAPAWLHLGIILVLGLAMPTALVAWLTAAAQ